MSETAIVVPAYNEPRVNKTLEALYNQSSKRFRCYIVDNNSTDDTLERITYFARQNSGFPMEIINEEQKGTGAASDTGFRRAAKNGARIVARTDADTIPSVSWVSKIEENFGSEEVQLLGGRTNAIRDEDFRRGDDLLLRVALNGARLGLSVKHLDLNYLKAVNGANLATRSSAYKKTGGFVRSSIDELDEDVEYSIRIARQFGPRSIKLDKDLIVETSMRRIRRYGVAKMALHHAFPNLRSGAYIDVRYRGE